mmetsp:Transcript_69063/g.191262  ORF Transcript_69063/g.191262 Transcript_69063/m.191262 type:complete len:264 (-) Transcript_69063:313-1104(-)
MRVRRALPPGGRPLKDSAHSARPCFSNMRLSMRPPPPACHATRRSKISPCSSGGALEYGRTASSTAGSHNKYLANEAMMDFPKDSLSDVSPAGSPRRFAKLVATSGDAPQVTKESRIDLKGMPMGTAGIIAEDSVGGTRTSPELGGNNSATRAKKDRRFASVLPRTKTTLPRGISIRVPGFCSKPSRGPKPAPSSRSGMCRETPSRMMRSSVNCGFDTSSNDMRACPTDDRCSGSRSISATRRMETPRQTPAPRPSACAPCCR